MPSIAKQSEHVHFQHSISSSCGRLDIEDIMIEWEKKNQIQAFYLPEIFFVSEINFSNNNVNIIFYHFMLFFDRIENLNLTINDCIRFVTMMMMMMIIIIHHWLNVIFKRSLIIEILSRIDKFFFVLFCFFIFLFEFF